MHPINTSPNDKEVSKACRLCGSNQLEKKFTANACHLDICQSCGFLQVAIKPTHEELHRIYSGGYFTHGKYKDTDTLSQENGRRKELMEFLKRGSQAKILDAGCASGDFIFSAKKDFDMWGLDISEYAIAQAKNKNPELAARLHAGLVEQQPYEDRFFDGIVMWDVIEHIWDPLDTCEKLFRYLRPNGYLFLSTPNKGALTARLMGKYWAFMTPPEHLGFFDKKTIHFLFEKKINGKVVHLKTKGKRANVGFLFYKLKRIFPRLIPGFLIRLFQTQLLRKLSVYVPTGDVQYAIIHKLP